MIRRVLTDFRLQYCDVGLVTEDFLQLLDMREPHLILVRHHHEAFAVERGEVEQVPFVGAHRVARRWDAERAGRMSGETPAERAEHAATG